MSVWLRDQGGVRVPVADGSVLIGRSPTCHIVVPDPAVSRQHALIVALESGVQVVALGRGAVVVRQLPIDEPTLAHHGDEIVVGAAHFCVEVDDADTAPIWMIVLAGRHYPVRRSGLSLGGGARDDLRVPGWPDGAARLFPVPGGVVAEIHEQLVVRGARAEDGLAQLTSGAALVFGAHEATIALAENAPVTADLNPAPTEAHLELLPNGALLKLTLDRVYSIWLPQRRGDLFAALLSPPAGLRSGDWVSDELLIPRIWGSESATRVQLNTVIHRTRLSITSAGLNGPSLIERAPGGGSTRAHLARGAITSVQ